MEVTTIRVTFKDKAHRIGIYPGLSALELSKLLTAAFGLNNGGGGGGGGGNGGGDTSGSGSHGPLSAASATSPGVVGFQDESTGVILPISLACSGLPLLSTASSYRLLLTESEDFLLPGLRGPGAGNNRAVSPTQQHQQQQQKQQHQHQHQHQSPVGVTPTSSASSLPAMAAPAGYAVTAAAAAAAAPTAGAAQEPQASSPAYQEQPSEASSLLSADYDRQLDLDLPPQWQAELQGFLEALAGQGGLLTGPELGMLRALLAEGHIALAAAYRVASRRRNRELLAAFLTRIARAALAHHEVAAAEDAAGARASSALEEQAEMLQMVEHVLQEQFLSPAQRADLEYLVLLQHEQVYAVFNRFATSDDVDEFCANLAALADNADRLLTMEEGGSYVGREGEEAAALAAPDLYPHSHSHPQQHPQQQPSLRPPRAPASVVKPLEEVIRDMGARGGLRPVFVEWLLGRARAQDAYVMAAYEIYEFDKDEDELVDSLRRILKVRIEALRLEQRKRQLHRQQSPSPRPALLPAAAPVHDAQQAMATAHHHHHYHHSQHEQQHQQHQQHQRERQQPPVPPPAPLPPTPQAPPQEFTAVVLAAVRRGRLPQDQGQRLCDLYAQGHEAVRAAWALFLAGKHDEEELLGACARVARVAAAAEQAAVATAAAATATTTSAPTTASAPSSSSLSQQTAGAAASTPSPVPGPAPAAGSSRRAATRSAVLTQSLDLMLARGTVDLAGQRRLMKRLKGGDQPLLGALEAFMADHDVELLLRRLARLARQQQHQQQQPSSSTTTSSTSSSHVGASSSHHHHNNSSSSNIDSMPPPVHVSVGARHMAGPPTPATPGTAGADEDLLSFASDRAVKCSAASVGSLMPSEDDQSVGAGPATPTLHSGAADGHDDELGEEDREELLSILASTGFITDAERRLLRDAAAGDLVGGGRGRKDRALLAIFDDFSRTQDVERFQGALRDYLATLKAMMAESRPHHHRSSSSSSSSSSRRHHHQHARKSLSSALDGGAKEARDRKSVEEDAGAVAAGGAGAYAGKDHEALLQMMMHKAPAPLPRAAALEGGATRQVH